MYIIIIIHNKYTNNFITTIINNNNISNTIILYDGHELPNRCAVINSYYYFIHID